MTPRPGLREKKELEVKQAFYRAAMRLFRDKGFEATSVDEIAENAGFSRATYFNHFGTKRGVLRYYGEQLQADMAQLLVEIKPNASSLERLHELLVAMAREADRHVEDLKIIYRHSLNDPDYLTRPTRARKKLLEMVGALVVESQQQGGIRRDLPASVIAFHIMSLYNGAVLAAMSGARSAEKTITLAWQLILRGVKGGDSLAP